MKKSILAIIVATFLLTGCAEMFQSKVDMSIGNNGGGLAGLLQEKSAITELFAPAQLIVSKGDSSTYIDLIWSNVEDAVFYQIERAEAIIEADGSSQEPEESEFQVLEKAWYFTSYRDETCRNRNVHYYYRVCAKNTRDNLEDSPYSSIVYGNLFGIPESTRADLGVGTESITVYWSKVPSATSYEIYRSKSSDGTGAVLLSTVPATETSKAEYSYVNSIAQEDQGTEFYYIVYAVNRLNMRSSASPIAMGFTLMDGAPSQPSNVKVVNGRGTTSSSIEISWDPVGNTGTGLTYIVYRSSSQDSALVQIAKLTNNETKYEDKLSLKPNLYYYYQIQVTAKDEFDQIVKSPFSDSGRFKADGSINKDAAEGFIISPTEELLVEKINANEVNLKWLPAIGTSEQLKYRYKVFGGTSSNGPFDEIKIVESDYILKDGYIEATVSGNPFYTVVTVNPTTGAESANSIVAAPTPSAAKIGTASRAAHLGDIVSANSSGVYPVRITWEKPNDSDLGGFHVYRSNTRDSGYRKITDVPLSVNATSYIDSNETSKAGKKYWYKVLSVNALGQGRSLNECTPVEGWGALTHEQYLREFNKTVVAAQKKLTLMHKPGNTDKLGSETLSGEISGTISYNASLNGFGAKIIMRYEGYADFFVDGTQDVYFKLTGNSNTDASMDSSGTMNGTVTCTGMYPGKVSYDSIQIKGGAAGGGTYGVEPEGFPMKQITYTLIN